MIRKRWYYKFLLFPGHPVDFISGSSLHQLGEIFNGIISTGKYVQNYVDSVCFSRFNRSCILHTRLLWKFYSIHVFIEIIKGFVLEFSKQRGLIETKQTSERIRHFYKCQCKIGLGLGSYVIDFTGVNCFYNK